MAMSFDTNMVPAKTFKTLDRTFQLSAGDEVSLSVKGMSKTMTVPAGKKATVQIRVEIQLEDA